MLIQNRGEEKRILKEKDLQELKSYKEKAKRLNYQKEYVKDKRCRETDEQYESHLCDLRMRAKNLYARETDEQCEARLQDLRMRALNRYASKTNEQHQVRLMDARMRDQERHANESEEQREISLSRLCQRDHETRGTETDEQRAQRNQRMKEYMQQLAANEPPPAPSPERARQLELLR